MAVVAGREVSIPPTIQDITHNKESDLAAQYMDGLRAVANLMTTRRDDLTGHLARHKHFYHTQTPWGISRVEHSKYNFVVVHAWQGKTPGGSDELCGLTIRRRFSDNIIVMQLVDITPGWIAYSVPPYTPGSDIPDYLYKNLFDSCFRTPCQLRPIGKALNSPGFVRSIPQDQVIDGHIWTDSSNLFTLVGELAGARCPGFSAEDVTRNINNAIPGFIK